VSRSGAWSGRGEADRAGQPLAVQPGQELVAGSGAVGADQDPPPGPGPGPVPGQLRQLLLGDRDVVGGGVGAGVTCPQQHRQRLPAALGAVVEERPQRVVAEPALERRRRPLLVRVGGHQRRVEIDDQRRRGARPAVGGLLAGQGPYPRAGRRPRRVNRGQGRGGVGRPRGDRARHRRVRGTVRGAPPTPGLASPHRPRAPSPCPDGRRGAERHSLTPDPPPFLIGSGVP
jgi:hypothetical protein